MNPGPSFLEPDHLQIASFCYVLWTLVTLENYKCDEAEGGGRGTLQWNRVNPVTNGPQTSGRIKRVL